MFDAHSIYGTPRVEPDHAAYDTSPGIATVSLPNSADQIPQWSLEHPLMVFAILLAAAAGFVGFASSGHIGPASASVSVGKGK